MVPVDVHLIGIEEILNCTSNNNCLVHVLYVHVEDMLAQAAIIYHHLSSTFQILCMQEVQESHLEEFYIPQLKALGM